MALELNAQELSQKVAAHAKAGPESDYVLSCTTEAIDLIKQHIGEATVPEAIATRAVIETAAELYWRRNARNGIAQFNSGEGIELMRVGADPMHAARIILRPWLGVPIA